MLDIAPLVNKSVDFKFMGAELRLDLSHALFSSFDVDLGTRLLLKAVARDPALAGARRVLDEGCGIGVIGLCVAKAFPEVEVVLRDRDSLALAFAERNRKTNKLRGRSAWTDPETGAVRTAVAAPKVLSSLLAADPLPLIPGRDGEGSYDYILSNLPAKAGAPVLAAFFARARARLRPSGRIAVVIVNSLAEAATGWIEAAALRIETVERGSGHRVFILEAAPEGDAASVTTEAAGGAFLDPPPALADPYLDLSSLDLSVYIRGELGFTTNKLRYTARGFWGLPDFDTVGYAPALAAELAARACAGSLVREALVINPGVGHLPLWIAKTLGPGRLLAASRDILSLAATGANLAALPARARPEYQAVDALRLDELPPYALDFLAEVLDVVPEYDWISPAWERAGRLLKSGASYVAVGHPTELGRLEKRRPSGWRLLAEKRRKGFAAAAWRRG